MLTWDYGVALCKLLSAISLSLNFVFFWIVLGFWKLWFWGQRVPPIVASLWSDLTVLWYHSMFGVLQNEVLENSVKSLTDELQDVRAERDVFQQKAHRLNVEMNHIVGNDEIRILDIDALCMENRSASPDWRLVVFSAYPKKKQNVYASVQTHWFFVILQVFASAVQPSARRNQLAQNKPGQVQGVCSTYCTFSHSDCNAVQTIETIALSRKLTFRYLCTAWLQCARGLMKVLLLPDTSKKKYSFLFSECAGVQKELQGRWKAQQQCTDRSSLHQTRSGSRSGTKRLNLCFRTLTVTTAEDGVWSWNLWSVRSEGTAAFWRKRLQLAADASVHLRPQVSCHSSAGNHPWKKHGHTAPAPDQQVLQVMHHVSCTHHFQSTVWHVFCSWRILGTRVAELEKKLKTLEISGLWSLPGRSKTSVFWYLYSLLEPAVFTVLVPS